MIVKMPSFIDEDWGKYSTLRESFFSPSSMNEAKTERTPQNSEMKSDATRLGSHMLTVSVLASLTPPFYCC
jgi:hypothetical protein